MYCCLETAFAHARRGTLRPFALRMDESAEAEAEERDTYKKTYTRCLLKWQFDGIGFHLHASHVRTHTQRLVLIQADMSSRSQKKGMCYASARARDLIRFTPLVMSSTEIKATRLLRTRQTRRALLFASQYGFAFAQNIEQSIVNSAHVYAVQHMFFFRCMCVENQHILRGVPRNIGLTSVEF